MKEKIMKKITKMKMISDNINLLIYTLIIKKITLADFYNIKKRANCDENCLTCKYLDMCLIDIEKE
jgi:hypothetical protein